MQSCKFIIVIITKINHTKQQKGKTIRKIVKEFFELRKITILNRYSQFLTMLIFCT